MKKLKEIKKEVPVDIEKDDKKNDKKEQVPQILENVPEEFKTGNKKILLEG